MNKIISSVLVAVGLAFVLPSCQKAPFILMTGPSSFTFPFEGGTQTFTFSCNRDWSVSSSESWISIVPVSGASGKGDGTVTITCSPNYSYQSRTATISVTAADVTAKVFVTQDPGVDLLVVSPKSVYLSPEEQTLEIAVQKKIDYTVSIDRAGSEWIKYEGTQAQTADKVTFKVSANASDPRSGVITFKQKDGEISETVNIRQAVIGDYEISLRDGGDKTEVTYTLCLAGSRNGYRYLDKMWVENASEYVLVDSATYMQYEGSEATGEIVVPWDGYAETVNDVASGFGSITSCSETFAFSVSAWSLYNVFCTKVEVISLFEVVARPKGVFPALSNEVIGKFYVRTINSSIEYEEHAHPAHASQYEEGHGHGHKNGPNAGGGLVQPE